MPKVAIVDDQLLIDLITEMKRMRVDLNRIGTELLQSKKPYLSTQDLMELTGFSSKWVIDNKSKIGFTEIGNQLRFKRKDVEQFMEQNYIKPKKH